MDKQDYIHARLDEALDCINQALNALDHCIDPALEILDKNETQASVEEKCSSYITYHYKYPHYKEEGHCLGTKEVEPCSCHGLKQYCDFYKED